MSNLPIKKTDEFLAEVEVMDLTPIKDGLFVVAVGTGNPEGFNLLGSTLHGPYTFVEMVQEVGDMWSTHQHHAKVIKLDKNYTNETQMLDPNTIEYIEYYYTDIITEEMLGGAFDDKEFTCQAGFNANDGKDPRHQEKPKEETLGDNEEDAP